MTDQASNRPAPVELGKLGDQVAPYLRDLIMSGQVRPGMFLRVDKLAADLDVSATPVREALLALRAEGFVQLVRRRGFVVSPLREQDVRDLFASQAELSGELAARAARHVNPSDVTALNRLQDQLEAAAARGDVVELESANHRIHRYVNLKSDAPKLTLLLAVAARYSPRTFYGEIEGWQKASVNEHRSIIDALAFNDGTRARSLMRDHVTDAGELLIEHLRDVGLWDAATETS